MSKILITMRIEKELLGIIDNTAKRQFKTRTQFFIDSSRRQLNDLKVKIPGNKLIQYMSDEELEIGKYKKRYIKYEALARI